MNKELSQNRIDDGENTTEKAIYSGTVKSSSLSGEAKLFIGKDGLSVDALFDEIALPYAEIESITLENYAIHIRAGGEDLQISQMGSNCDWFHRELYEGFNRKVQTVLRAKGTLLIETKGRYNYDNNRGEAYIRVFNDCLCILPPNKDGRRIPLTFVSAMKSEDYALSIMLTTGEHYEFSMLGYDLDPLEKTIAGAIRKLREKNAAFVSQLDSALDFAKISQAARQLPEGIAVPLAELSKTLSSLSSVLEKKANNSKMSGTYPVLKTICYDEKLCIGIRALPEEEVKALKQELPEIPAQNAGDGVASLELTPEQEDALRWIIWVAIPSKDERTAVVEFAFPNEQAATYIFKLNSTFEHFLPLLNRAMEATGLQREVVSLSDEEILKNQHADKRMLLERTPALQKLRQCFAGKAIHRSMDSWKNNVLEHLS